MSRQNIILKSDEFFDMRFNAYTIEDIKHLTAMNAKSLAKIAKFKLSVISLSPRVYSFATLAAKKNFDFNNRLRLRSNSGINRYLTQDNNFLILNSYGATKFFS